MLIVSLWSASTLAASFTIDPAQQSDLREQRFMLKQKQKELDDIGKKIEKIQSERNFAMRSIKNQETESMQARKELEKLQNFDRENPGVISPDQLRSAEGKNKQAYNALKLTNEKRTEAEAKIHLLNVDAESQYAEVLRLQSSFERDVDRVVDAQLQERIRALQVTKVVEVTERVPCGDDSVPVCKERSKKAAELKATERGSVVFVNSLTEVKNFKLSKEELRSEVQATLSDKVFSNQHMVGETEYETTIKANVVPAISSSLREQMAGSIRSEVYVMVGGKVDVVSNKSLATTRNMNAEDEEMDKPALPRLKQESKQGVLSQKDVEPPVVQQQSSQPAAPRHKIKPTISF